MIVPVLLVVLSAHAVQQNAPTARDDDTALRTLPTRVLHDAEHLAGRKPLIVIAAGGALAALVHPADASIVNRFKPEAPAEEALDGGSVGGDAPEQAGLALGVYAIGRLSRHAGAEELGTELVEAQLVNAIPTEIVKVTVDRRRPNGGHYSFPSGHSSASFATADIFEQRFGWKIGLLAYAGATYVVLSRLGEHAHYPSDTLFGAAIGIAAARSVRAGRGAHGTVKGFSIVPALTKGGAAIFLTRADR